MPIGGAMRFLDAADVAGREASSAPVLAFPGKALLHDLDFVARVEGDGAGGLTLGWSPFVSCSLPGVVSDPLLSGSSPDDTHEPRAREFNNEVPEALLAEGRRNERHGAEAHASVEVSQKLAWRAAFARRAHQGQVAHHALTLFTNGRSGKSFTEPSSTECTISSSADGGHLQSYHT